MRDKSEKRKRMEASLAEDPADPFLRYGLALQCLHDGDVDEGRRGLIALIADRPTDQVAAHQQLGQSYLDADEPEEARRWLTAGIALARAVGDAHAANEMQGFVAQLG